MDREFLRYYLRWDFKWAVIKEKNKYWCENGEYIVDDHIYLRNKLKNISLKKCFPNGQIDSK